MALMGLFARRDYYTCKLSSSIIASLITGTPLVLTHEAMQAYSFLNESSAFLQVRWAMRIMAASPT